MTEKIISLQIEGGKATAGPPLGPALGPMGINAGKVVADINEKTKAFSGITVPVKVIVNAVSKSYEIEVGSPSTSALIKKELALEKGSGSAKELKVGDITIDQLIKIARSKESALLSRDQKKALKEIVGTCVTMGVTIDFKSPQEVEKEIDQGKYDDKVFGKVALSEISKEEIEEKKAKYAKIAEEKKKVAEAEAAAKAAATAAAAPAAEAGKPGAATAGKPAAAGKPEAKAEAKKEEKKK